MTYVPTPVDVMFQQNLVRIVSDGGVWAWRSTPHMFRLDHKKKIFWLIRGEADENFDKVKAVCLAIGWDAQKQDNNGEPSSTT